MIIDFTVSNFRSFQQEQLFSMNVESARDKHPSNFSLYEDGKISVLRSAAILGANASGKTNLLAAILALRWIVTESGMRGDGEAILEYKPFRLSVENENKAIIFQIEFVVPSGVRYRYEIAFDKNNIVEERLYSFARRAKAIIFDRSADDTWETIKFGGTYKGGNRRFPFFPNAAYLSRAGNDASAPEFIREIFSYFRNMIHITPHYNQFPTSLLNEPATLVAVSELVHLADTGVSNITIEKEDGSNEVKSERMLDLTLNRTLREIRLTYKSRLSTKYWIKSKTNNLIPFEYSEMSDGTIRLFAILPAIIQSLKAGSVLLIDEINAHFHSKIVDMILRLFHDSEINAKGSQIIFTTHDTSILNSSVFRRDQIWLVSKQDGSSSIRSLDEYDKKYVRHDSPFEDFYKDGRLGAIPLLSFAKVKGVTLAALKSESLVGKE